MEKDVAQDNHVTWDSEAESKFEQMLERMPFFARPMAEIPVSRKAEELAKQDPGGTVNEKILIDAFFEITPFGFHGPMMTDMDFVGLDYKKYGHPIDYTA